MEQYYLIKKSDVDYYYDLFENFRKEHKEDEIGAGAIDALFGIANILADAKLVDLSDESENAGEDKALLFVNSRNYKEDEEYSTINESYIAYTKDYSQALQDIKQTLNETK